MDWLDGILFKIGGYEVSGWMASGFIFAYLAVGFVISRVYWWWQMRGYKNEVEEARRKFLHKNGINGDEIPANLRWEWSGDVDVLGFSPRKEGLKRPKTFLCMFAWPLAVIAMMLNYLFLWPIIRVADFFAGMDDWIKERGLGNVDLQLPSDTERAEKERQDGREELKKLQKDKTIGPKK